jgi:hypothetical protein
MYGIFGQDPNRQLAAGYKGAIPGIQQAVGQATGYLSPYQQTGVSATGDLYAHLQGMADPKAYLASLTSGYQMSPAAKFQEQQGMNVLQNKAAALGLTGSGQETKDALRFSQGIASQDMQQYLNNILGINRQYMGGMQGLGGMGLQAGLGMGREAIGGAEDVAKMQMAEEQAKARAAQQKQSFLSNILGTAGGAAASILPYL